MRQLKLTLLLFFLAVFFFPAPAAIAADGTIDADGTYDISAYGSNSLITIDSLASTDGLTVTLTNTSGATYTNLRILCVDAGTKLTIDGVNIDNSTASGAYALAFSGAGNMLTLAGSSVVTGGSNEPGVRVEAGAALTLAGSGALTANGGVSSAGIGAGQYADAGTIIISGGTVIATGGNGGAGIGGGRGQVTGVGDHIIYTSGGNGGNVTISGGTVSASGGTEGAGIGAGSMGEGGVITITGGSITAAGIGGAGLGGGYCSAYVWGDNSIVMGGTGDGGTITISGGLITATSSYNSLMGPGAGIGGGFSGEGGTITISGGAITATSDPGGSALWGGAGIGGGAWNDGIAITVTGGTITANGGSGGAGLGGGAKFSINAYTLIDRGTGAGGAIVIGDGTVVATGGQYAAGIGGGGATNAGATVGGSGGTVDISGGVVYAEGDAAHAAFDIGSGNNSTEGSLTITGTASVFLRHDASLPPTLPVPHSHKTTADTVEPMVVENGTIYGIAGTGVSPWKTAAGGYFLLNRVVYDGNGGSGFEPNTAQVPGTTAILRSGSGFYNNRYENNVVGFWNTEPDGSGTTYYPGGSLPLTQPSITLYAQWIWVPLTGDGAAPWLPFYAALVLLSAAGLCLLLRRAAHRPR